MVQARAFRGRVLIGLAAAMTIVAAALPAGLAYGRWHTAQQLLGADLGGRPAPEFTLADQTGQRMSLADFRGRLVLVAFVYTHDPVLSPMMVEKVRRVLDQAGQAAADVRVLLISVDPAADDPASIQSFRGQHKLDYRWLYLSGTADQLQPVWAAYYVAAQPVPVGDPTVGSVLHTDALFVIDKQGRERVLFTSDFDLAELLQDVGLLSR